MENPVGTGAYRLKEWTRGQRIVLEANPGLSRRHVSGAGPGQRPRRRRDRQGTRRPQAAAGRQRRHQHHRGGAAAAALLRLRQARLHRRCRRRSPSNVLDGAALKPEYAKRGIDAAPRDRAVDLVLLLQPRRSAGRRLHAGEARAAARDQHGLRPRDRDRAAAARPGASRRRSPCRRRLYGHDPKYVAPLRLRSRARRARCSTSSATRTATATAIASCPTASR